MAFILLNFESPYHIGWRTAEPIIEGITVHRALIYASVLVTGDAQKTTLLTQLQVSAALPALASSGCYKLLLPFPPIPSRIAAKKKGLKWITLKALNIIAMLTKHRLPYIAKMTSETAKGEAEGEIVLKSDDMLIKLCYSNEVIYECDEKVKIPPRILHYFEVHLNRIDRITNAADVYRISGYKPITKLGVILKGNEEVVDYGVKLFRVLEELGIGGFRSHGFGKFVVEQGKLCEENTLTWSRGPGTLVLLGSYELTNAIDISRSIINKKLITGYAGPSHDSYTLPHLNYIGAGSIVYTARSLDPIEKHVKTSHMGALIIFNPVAIGEAH